MVDNKLEEISEKINKELNETRENPKKVDDQSILMFHLAELSNASKEIRTTPERVDKKGRFLNLLVLDNNSPYLLPNFLLGPEEERSSFLRLTNLQLSLLTPRIRLFKVVYNASLEKETEGEIPFDDVASKNDLDKIFSTSSGRGTGAGIKNFTWKTMATNQANLSQFSATLTLFVQNIEEMTKIRNSIDDNGRIFDITLLDLLYQKPSLRGGINEGTNVYDPKYFGVKMEVGWHLDTTNNNVIETFKNESRKYNEDGQKVLDTVLEQTQTFYMTLIGHSFNIIEDGSMELTIEYICTAESEANDIIKANILSLTDEKQLQIRNIQERLKKIEKNIEKREIPSDVLDVQQEFNGTLEKVGVWFAEDVLGMTDPIRDKVPDGEVLEKLKEEKERLQQEMNKIPRGYRIERFKSITERLLKAGLIRGICKTKAQMDTFIDLRYFSINTLEDIELLRKKIKDISSANAKEVQDDSLTQSAWNTAKNTTEQNIDGNQETKTLNTQNLTEDRGVFCDEKDAHQINFFYLGDLVDVLLEDLFNVGNEEISFINKTTRIILGSITYYDFGSLVDNGLIIRKKGLKDKDSQLVRTYRGAKTIVNIADVPISFNEFVAWFVNEYADRENISFLEFVKEMINNFLVGIFGGDFFTFAPGQQVLVEMFPFSVPQNEKNEELFNITKRGIDDRETGRTFRYSIDSSLKPFMTTRKNKTDSKKQNYILFYGSNQPPFEKTGDEEKDLKDKIYHLYIGEQRSIIKKINFQRQDSPRNRANNVQLANPEKQQSGVFIREVYNVSLEMIGNFLFMPGQTLFIHPTYPGQLGQNERENLFRKLGMGGYYFITEVNHHIESGEFKTNIIAVWTCFGDGAMNVGDKMIGDNILEDSSTNTPNTPAQLVLEQ